MPRLEKRSDSYDEEVCGSSFCSVDGDVNSES